MLGVVSACGCSSLRPLVRQVSLSLFGESKGATVAVQHGLAASLAESGHCCQHPIVGDHIRSSPSRPLLGHVSLCLLGELKGGDCHYRAWPAVSLYENGRCCQGLVVSGWQAQFAIGRRMLR